MKLLLTGAFTWTEVQKGSLRDMGFDILYAEREDGVLPPEAGEADAVICNWLFAKHPIQQFPKLRYIQLLSAGLDRVPLGYIRENGIVLHNARGVYSIPMAEYAVSGVLQLYKHAEFFSANKRAALWQKNRELDELYGKTVLIAGCGSVGSETAKRFSALTDQVYGVRRHPDDAAPFFKAVYPVSELDALLPGADVVVLTVPLTEATRHMFDRGRFSLMKPGAIFVNIARGGCVDEPALIQALRGRLGGAVLDVFEQEPLPVDSPLWTMDRVLITPHNSFVSQANAERMWRVCAQNLKDWLR